MIFNMGGGGGLTPEQTLDETTITPGTENQVIPKGTFLRGPLTVLGDADLIPENIMKNVNIFSIEGGAKGGSGKNVWNKHVIVEPRQYVTNPKLTCTYSENDHVTTIRLHSSGFKVTHITDWRNFFNGFMRTSEYGFKLSGSTLTLTGVGLGTGSWDGSVTLSNFKIVDDTTVTFSTNKSCYLNGWTYTYTGQKMVKDIELECVEYVVNDDASAYPNGAEHTDGFYYTLLGHVDSANVMSLSNDALATVQGDYREQIETEVSQS